MNYLKFTQYAYLIAAVLFAIDGFREYNAGNKEGAYLRFGFTAIGVFMFFFRRKFARKFARKFEDHNKKP